MSGRRERASTDIYIPNLFEQMGRTQYACCGTRISVGRVVKFVHACHRWRLCGQKPAEMPGAG
jgi:hypothetical protein